MPGQALTVVIPLGGLGSRFQNEGHFTRPKPFVKVHGKEMILWVLEHLKLEQEDALVICYNPAFMRLNVWMQEVVRGQYPGVHLVELPGPTRGAAETVLLALRGIPEEVRKRPVMLCDGDTFYTHDIVGAFRTVAGVNNASFVFHDTQPKPIYSYCIVDSAMMVKETKEKVKISDWANSGCYCFRNGQRLEAECAGLLAQGETQLSQDKVPEYYTSGVITRMLAQGEPFKALEVPVQDIHVLGTPAQVTAWCRARAPPVRARFAFSLSTLRGRKGEDVARVADFCKAMFKQGHRIAILTPPDSTAEWLEANGIQYHELLVGMEPDCEYLVSNSAVNPLLGLLEYQTGFYSEGVPLQGAVEPTRRVVQRKPDLAGLALVFGLGAVIGAALMRAVNQRL